MNLTVAGLTFGAAALGNLGEEYSEQDARAVLEAAWSAGIRAFDTAPHYGLGLSEQRLGDFLAEVGPGAHVSTKVGRLLIHNPDGTAAWDEEFRVRTTLRRHWDFTADGIRRSLEASDERLRGYPVGTVYLHDPERAPEPEQALAQGSDALVQLRRRHAGLRIGIGSMSVQTLARAADMPEFDELMVAGRHTLLDDSAVRQVLGPARAHGVDIAATAVFNSGLLADPRPSGNFNYSPASAEVLERAERIADICGAHGTDLPTAALHYAALDPAVTSVVVGMRTPEQVHQNVARVHDTPDPNLWSALAEEQLIPAVVS